MHATDIIAYAYDADYHCIEDTERAHPGASDWRREGFDPADYLDSEGNEIHPLFAADEWWEPSFDSCQSLPCGDCGAILDAIHVEDCPNEYDGAVSEGCRIE